MNIRKAASFFTLACCFILVVYIGAATLINLAQKRQTIQMEPAPHDALSFEALVQQRILNTAAENRGVNINAASREELMTLPGIGEHLAGLIIQTREQQPFFFLEDLRQVPGIGEKRLAALRGLAYVNFPAEALSQLPLLSPAPIP